MRKTCLLFVAVFLFAGCSDESNRRAVISGDLTELLPRMTNATDDVKPLLIEQMKPEDVIVSINGYPLTRAEFDARMVILAKQLMKARGANAQSVGQQIDREKKRFIKKFVSSRLLLDDAHRLKVTTVENVNAKVAEALDRQAKKLKKTSEMLLKSYPGDEKYFYYDLAERYWQQELISKHIPPEYVVDDEMVSNMQAQVANMNAAAARSNEVVRATMQSWLEDLRTGKKTFEGINKKLIPDGEMGDFVMGTFERTGIDDMNLRAAAFALKRIGDYTEVLEDDGSFYIVKLLEILPPIRNDKGEITIGERRKLGHIRQPKEDVFVRIDDKAMFEDLKQQLQDQAISRHVEMLKTNGLNTVVYPHGTSLFK